MPQGSEFDGKVVGAHGLGWGIKHESAAITVHFDSVRLPDGRVHLLIPAAEGARFFLVF